MRYFWPVNGKYLYIYSLVFIVLLGAVLRLHWLMYVNSKGEYIYDEYYLYVSTAQNAFQGKGFFPAVDDPANGICVHAPLQALFVLLTYKIAGTITSPLWPRLIQLCLSLIAIILCASIGKSLVSPLAGIILAFMVAIYPDFVFWTGFLQTENNYLFGLTFLLWILLVWNDNPKPIYAVAAALCLGLLNLQRGNTLLLSPVIALYALCAFKKERRSYFSAFIFAVIPFCVLLPWLARNLAVYGDPILVFSHTGIQLHVANRLNYSPIKTPYVFDYMAENENHGVFSIPEIEKKCRAQDGESLPYNTKGSLTVTGYRYANLYQKAALIYIINHPVHFFKNYILKMFNQFYLVQDITRIAVPFLSNQKVFWIFDRMILIGGLSGLFFLMKGVRKKGLYVMVIIFAYFALTGALFTLSLDGRFNLFLKFFLILFMSLGSAQFFLQFKKHPGDVCIK